jgi:hypothetical protein
MFSFFIDMFVKCNWVVTRWQYTFTHKHYMEWNNNNQTTQITINVEEPCPIFASFTLEFALQLRKKHGKTPVRVQKTSVRLRKTSVRIQYTYYQNTHSLQTPHTHSLQNTHTHMHMRTRTRTHTHAHTLQNNVKLPQYKLKQTQCKIYPNEIVTTLSNVRSIKSH